MDCHSVDREVAAVRHRVSGALERWTGEVACFGKQAFDPSVPRECLGGIEKPLGETTPRMVRVQIKMVEMTVGLQLHISYRPVQSVDCHHDRIASANARDNPRRRNGGSAMRSTCSGE